MTSVEIIHGDKRFAVISKYDRGLVTHFKTIDKRHYNAEKHEWTFPKEKLEEFLAFLDKGKYQYTKTSTKNQAKVEKSAKGLELSFSSFIEDFNVFKQIEGSVYDRQISKWIIPLDKQPELEETLQKYKFSFIVQLKEEEDKQAVNSEETTGDSDTTDGEPLKKMQKKTGKISKKNE